MNSAAAVTFTVLLGTGILSAQSGNQGQIEVQKTASNIGVDGKTVWTTQAAGHAELAIADVQIPTLINACPISLHARQAPGEETMQVNGSRAKGVAQRLHLTIGNADSRKIVAANVTVHGFANKGRILQTMASQDSSDTAKALDVRFVAESGNESSADVSAPGFSAVSSIDLNSVTYADGSTWKLAASGGCRSWIDGLMLVGSR